MPTQIFTGKTPADGIKMYDSEAEKRPKLNLVASDDPILSKPAAPVVVDSQLLDWMADFISTYMFFQKLLGRSVVGLAAPQVGKSIRCFIAYGELYLNPIFISAFRGRDETMHEGCLSLPLTQSWPVTRPYGIIMRWEDLTGKTHEKRFNGINARVMLHEMDHLNGRLCNGNNQVELPATANGSK